MKNRFWQMWKVSIQSNIWYVLTPWFCLEIGSAAVDWSIHENLWSGIRFHYSHGRGWLYENGDLMFSKHDLFLSQSYYGMK